MTTHSNRHQTAGNEKKVTHFLVLAFFLCALTAHAQSNIVTGTAYGTNAYFWATTNSISSLTNGAGDLTVNFAGTSDITLTHQIEGSINIQSDFPDLTINATGATVSNWQDAAVLHIDGGTNLTLTGGSYIGLQGTNTYEYPPIPEEESQYYYSTNASMGGLISGVQTGSINNVRFEGATRALGNNAVVGTGALQINNSGALTITGTNSAFIGGNSGNIYSSTNDTFSSGGTALGVSNSAVTINNGTFSGGSSGDAETGDGYNSSSIGGSGIFANNATIEIYDGTFTGGTSGNADLSYGGDAIFATNSTLTIHGGTFAGGDAGTATTSLGGAALFSYDSNVTINDGGFQGGQYGIDSFYGLYSRVSLGGTNEIALNGGTFNKIGFNGGGVQNVTLGTNLDIQGQLVQHDGELNINNQSNDPLQDTVIASGTMNVQNNFTLLAGGRFHLASDESFATFAGDFTNAPGASLWFTLGSATNNGLLEAQRVCFESNSTLGIVNNLPALQAGSSVTTEVVKATSGIFVDGVYATTNDFNDKVNIVGLEEGRTGLVGIMFDISTNNLSLRFSTKALREYWNASGQLATLADELDALTGLNSNLLAQVDKIADASTSGALVEQTYFTTFNTLQTALQGFQLATGQSGSRSSQFRQELKLIPPGAKGPTRYNELRGWGQYYGQFRQHDRAGLNPEYETQIHGGMIGIDKSFGNLLLGINAGAGNYTTTYETEAKERITAVNGALYGTYGTDNAYIDFGAGYGHNQVDSKTAEPFVLEGEYDAQVIGGHIGAGYDFTDSTEGMVFTPEVSIHYAAYEQDAYTETGTIPRQIEAFESDSLRSSLGLNLSTLNKTKFETFSFKYDVRFHWLREYNPEPGTMNFQLAGGNGTPYQLEHPLLDEDVYRIGIGASFFNTRRNQPKNVMFRVDYDALLGDGFNAHNFSGKVVYAF